LTAVLISYQTPRAKILFILIPYIWD
jgi:hypothetical protein